MRRSVELVGNTPLHEAAEHYPVDAWRVWTSKHQRNYTEESKVNNAVPAPQPSA